ncbi:ATP-binding response regulator [Geothermobacter ehrlichii]|nr:response regulator [Geothermobacter ehrlichii]
MTSTGAKPARILLVDDNEFGRYTTARQLQQGGYIVEEATTGQQALERAMNEEFDLVVLDVKLPDMDGRWVCQQLKNHPRTAELPVVHLSAAAVDDHDRVKGLELGADAYLAQPVEPAVLRATIQALLRTKVAMRKARENEERYRTLSNEFRQLLDALPDMLCSISQEFVISWVNGEVEKRMDLAAEQLVGRRCYQVFPECSAAHNKCPGRKTMQTGQEAMEILSDNQGRIWELRCFPTRDATGKLTGVIEMRRDITEQRLLEERLRQTEKLEAVGKLAGGVAHDFNNLLSVILSLSQLCCQRLEADHPLMPIMKQILLAAERSAEITQQLLTFARRHITRPKLFDLNQRVDKSLLMLRRLVREDIELRFSRDRSLPLLRFDPAQLDQILLNLVINARDAIQEKMAPGYHGVIEVGTAFRRQETDGEDTSGWLLLSVRDNGIGMDEATRKKIFDPFFTTKEGGRGSGLGLATVYGIVRQNRGSIEVESEPGRGSCFTICLPAVSHEADSPLQDHPAPEDLRGNETLLVVDDELQVLTAARLLLEEAGYRVLTANSPAEAEILAAGNRELSLLLTDVVMPKMTGPELAGRLVADHPGLKVILMSGYADQEVFEQMAVAYDELLLKPFTRERLLRQIRAVLDQPRMR